MTSSGTYAYNPGYDDVILEAFDRCGVRGTALTTEHMVSAGRSINLLFVDWSNAGINQWKRVLYPISLVANQATYSLPADCETVLDVYWSVINGFGAGSNIDTIMLPMGQSQYAEIPNKSVPGFRSTLYFVQKVMPQYQITFWQPPAVGAPSYGISLYYLQRIQDAQAINGQTADAPYRAQSALASDLALRLAEKFAPDRLQMLSSSFNKAWDLFVKRDQEDAPILLIPSISDYFPR